MTPLCHEDPEPLEGPNAFVIRLASANRLSSKQVRELELLSSWPRVQMLLEDVAPLRRKSAAYCPSCLRRCGFGRLGWELTFADACAGCGCWLVDTCNGCGESVSWERAALRSCDCGYSLLDQSAPVAPASLVHLSRLFELAFTGRPSPPCEGVDALAPDQLRDLVRLLGSYGTAHPLARAQKRAYSASLAASWSASTVAAEVLATWPKGFDEYLDRLAARSTATEAPGSLQRVFGAFYRALYQGLNHSAFNFVRDRFQAYALQHWPGQLTLRNRRIDPESLVQAKWEPVSRAMARLEISDVRIRALVAHGKVRAVQRTTQAGRTFVLVHRDDVDALAPAFAGEMTLTGAAAELRFKRSRLAALLPHICPDALQAVDGRSPWAIPRAWLDAWRTRLAQLPEVATSTAVESLGRLLRFSAWPPARLGALLNDVASGVMPVAGRLWGVPGLPAIVFDAGALRSWCDGNNAQRSVMTVPEVAVRMCIKQEVAYLLVRRGLLESSIRRDGTRKWSSVSDAQLERFNCAYVWCRDIAARLQRSPKATASLLHDCGVTQASGPLADRGRQVLYRRRDVSRALPDWGDDKQLGGLQ